MLISSYALAIDRCNHTVYIFTHLPSNAVIGWTAHRSTKGACAKWKLTLDTGRKQYYTPGVFFSRRKFTLFRWHREIYLRIITDKDCTALTSASHCHCWLQWIPREAMRGTAWQLSSCSSYAPTDIVSIAALLLAICRRPSGCTVASGVVGVVVIVVGVCNRSQMRTSKCTCLIFGVSIGLDPG